MSDVLDGLLARLKARLQNYSDRDRELAERVAKNLASLVARKLAGESGLEPDIAHAQAAAANLSVAVATDVLNELTNWLVSVGGALLDRVLPK